MFECLSKLFKQTFFVNFAIIKDEEYTCLKKIFAITEKAWSKEPKTLIHWNRRFVLSYQNNLK